MKVLVTGATGFTGGHLAQYLAGRGDEVHTATRWALDHLLDGRLLEDVVARPFDWREGWEYNVEAYGVAAGRPA